MAGTSYGYKSIELQYSEFYYKTEGNTYKPVEIKNDNQNKNVYPLKFKYDTEEKGFVLNSPYTHNIIHDYRFENMNDKFTKDIQGDSGNKSKLFPERTSLGEIIINLVDTDRFVKATTNNPNSSRSHTLVFLKLKNDTEKEANIIVGDFAGVENEFECANPEVLNKFLNRKREDIDSTVNNQLFYSHNANKSILDPIDNTDSKTVDKSSLITAIDGKEYHIYDFEKIDSKDPRNMYFINKNNTIAIDINFMQKYVPFVRKYIGALVEVQGKYEPKRWVNDEETTQAGIDEINNTYNKALQINNSIENLLNIFKIVKNGEINTNYLKTIKPYVDKDLINIETQLEQKKEELKNVIKKKNTYDETVKKNSEQIKNDIIINGVQKYINSIIIKKHASNETTLQNELIKLNEKRLSGVTNYGKDYVKYLEKLIESIIKNNEIRGIINKSIINFGNYYDNSKEHIIVEAIYNHVITNFNNWKMQYIKDKYKIAPFDDTTLKNLQSEVTEIYNKSVNYDTELKKKLTEMKLETNDEDLNRIKNYIGLDKQSNMLDYLGIDKNITLVNLASRLIETELRLLINNESNLLKKLLELLKTMELENFNRQQGIKEICENRLIEGKYINSSLFEVRNTIKTILYEKNNGKNISPRFIDECFDQYCPNHEYCFTSKEQEDTRIKSENKPQDTVKTTDGSNEPSDRALTDIFGKIYDVLKNDKLETINKMYKEIIVSVFCVFNISQSANDPPSVPYIDINDLKYIYNFKIDNTVELNKYLNIALGNITKNYGSKVKDLKDVLIVSKNLNRELENSKVINAVEYMINKKTEYFSGGKFFDNMKIVVKEFIDMIDKSNAISAIGTLEFLDQLAKFNKVSNICRADFNLEKHYSINTSTMKKLYE
jgi:hypothetical protein